MIRILPMIEDLSSQFKNSFVIVDKKIWNICGDKWNFANVYIAPEGEASKNFHEYSKCVDFLLQNGVQRDSHILAIGGGALSDMAGFVASTILRGIAWSIVPTTLLSMIDACIGGKVGINSERGKNLLGAFHFPSEIIQWTSFLNTLSVEELDSGKGELLKYCFLDEEVNFAVMHDRKLDEIIKLCQEFKKKIVKEDPKESGIRKWLNLGHTFGHALEFSHKIPHGVAVSYGIKLIFEIYQEVENLVHYSTLVKKINFGKEYNIDKIQVETVGRDKKIIGNNQIDLIRVKAVGDPYIHRVYMDELLQRYHAKS